MVGKLKRIDSFPATQVDPRNVDVWLPPAYRKHTDQRYPVLYLHDGQNLFDPTLSYSGIPWGVDHAMIRLMEQDLVPPAILVGIWNSPRRIPEYMPQRPYEGLAQWSHKRQFTRRYGSPPLSDFYLAFIVNELKPYIDATYRSLSGPAHTMMMGSSMGGLVSLYALGEYPRVFGGVACLSPSWTIAGFPLLGYLKEHLQPPRSHRVYLDSGVEAENGGYQNMVQRIVGVFKQSGYQVDKHLMVREYPGEPHSEAAWAKRIDRPLRFLLTGTVS
jgi:predicted alpha/beta superfamily hydrolase